MAGAFVPESELPCCVAGDSVLFPEKPQAGLSRDRVLMEEELDWRLTIWKNICWEMMYTIPIPCESSKIYYHLTRHFHGGLNYSFFQQKTRMVLEPELDRSFFFVIVD
jgi:hypothetical protein